MNGLMLWGRERHTHTLAWLLPCREMGPASKQASLACREKNCMFVPPFTYRRLEHCDLGQPGWLEVQARGLIPPISHLRRILKMQRERRHCAHERREAARSM